MDQYHRSTHVEMTVRQWLMDAAGITENKRRGTYRVPLVVFAFASLLGFVIGVVAYIVFFAPTARADDSQPQLGDTAAYGRLLAYAEEHGVTVTSRHSSPAGPGLITWGQADGWGNVWVASDATPEFRICILAHELTHAVHQEAGMLEADSETEAYFVGFRVCILLGYTEGAMEQLAQIDRFRGLLSTRVRGFAEELATVAEG